MATVPLYLFWKSIYIQQVIVDIGDIYMAQKDKVRPHLKVILKVYGNQEVKEAFKDIGFWNSIRTLFLMNGIHENEVFNTKQLALFCK